MSALFRGQDEIAQKIASRVAVTPGVGQVAGPVDLVYGENIRPGTVRPADKDQTLPGSIPSWCVFVVPTVPFEQSPYVGGQPVSGEPSDWSGIIPDSFQIVIRGNVDNEDEAFDLADAVFRAIDKEITTDYFAIEATQRPQWLRRDEVGSHEYVFNVTAQRCQ